MQALDALLNRVSVPRLVEPAPTAEQREAGQITLPSSIALELASNPFLRIGNPTIEQQLDRQFGAGGRSPEQSFALLRRWKEMHGEQV